MRQRRTKPWRKPANKQQFRGNVVPFKPGAKRSTGKLPPRNPSWFIALLIALPLATGTAVFLFGGPPSAEALALSFLDKSQSASGDRESGWFTKCSGIGWNCVIDGDTIRYHGEKIRIADINTPETYEAQCASEKALGDKATARMITLLNNGPFTLESGSRETDRYGRTLGTITRDGESLGAVLVAEGLAEDWKGYRSGWC